MQGKYIFRLTDPDLPNSIGNKASNMLTLSDLGLNIPDTYVCTWDAYLDQDGMVQESIKAEIENILDPNITYAVRSSVNVEDTLEHSYAGQFSTILEVSGVDELITAIQQVWDSAAKDEVRSYQQKTTSVDQDVKIAVIIQAMIAPRFSGVVFSKNPITGLDEIVIEAVEGVGTALVQDGATPLRWIHKWGDWLEKPPGDQKLEDLALKVVQQTEWIVKKTGKDVDLEWVYDGKELYWVQLREITALKDLRIYSNKISKEFLPGLIKPLVWSINVPLVNSAWVDLLSEVIGENDIDPSSMARSFYYRAYFDMTTFGEIFDRLGMPRQSLEINMGIVEPPENRPPFRPSPQMMALLPRILGFLINKWRFSRQVEAHFPEIETKLKAFDLENVDEYCLTELFAIIDQLYRTVGEAAYYNIIVPVLMFVYNGALRRQLGKIDIEFEKINLTHDMDELQDYDPNVHLARLNQEYRQLDSGLQDSIREVDYQAFTSLPGSDVFQESLQQFIERFGHFSDSGNDFSVPPWREDKDLILKLIINYQPAYGSQAQELDLEHLPAGVLQRWGINLLYHRARQFLYYRERVSSVYTYGYGLFRNYYLAVGELLVQKDLLYDPEDIFYLYDHEIREAAIGELPQVKFSQLVEKRKVEIEGSRDIDLPEIIYGDQAPPIVRSQASTLYGIPTSRGIYCGPTRVVSGIQDFDKLNDGDVLVIPYSDVGWTPLFARAGAVVAESGGMLSHSSIVAREYGIPAVVSVPGALKLGDNISALVDGYRGLVILQECDKENAP